MADTQQVTKKVPEVMWAQRKDVLYLTINLSDCKNPSINLSENEMFFSGVGGTDKGTYEIKLEFHAAVNKSESKFFVQDRNIKFVIKKKEEGPYWPHLLKGVKKAFWLKTDFNKWKDEDESDDEDDNKNMDLAEMMQNMGGGMGDMGGLGGMGEDDLGGDADGEDSDDEDLPDLA